VSAERFYRRLLWAYPGAYRRRQGAEIVTTLLEMAEDRPGRPTAGQTLHLVACGLRQRFRLPARRPLARVVALLAAVALGAAGATAGTWLGWQTAARVPSWSETSVLTTAAAGLPWASVERWTTAMNGPGVNSTISGTGTYDAERVRTALTADGWQITRFTEQDERFAVEPPITKINASGGREVVALDPGKNVPAKEAQFVATKDGLTLTGGTDTVIGGAQYGVDGRTFLSLDITADDTGAVRPMTIAGLLAGVLTGWLLTSAVAYRVLRAGRPHRRVAAALGVLALAAAAVPAFVAGCETYQVMMYDTHAPNQYIASSPADRIPAELTAAGAVLAVTALAGALVVAARRRPALDSMPVSA
jgi:hypothetical protein